jgi:hypothetical protein
MPNTDHHEDQPREREREHVETSQEAELVRAEIVALHVFLAKWLRGDLANDDDTFVAEFARRFDPAFVLVSPTGELAPLAQVTKRIRNAHGQSPALAIEIRNVVFRRDLGGPLLATYEEWQRDGGPARPDNARLSSVLLQPERVAPGGLMWLHLHECWLPGQR